MKNLKLKLASFSYENDQQILQKIDLNLAAGQLVLNLGRAQTGESTRCQ